MDEEVEIEVFRADTRASRGITAAHIADAAAAYDPANAPAAICLGHPKSDTPAFGRVKAYRADGPSLFATIPVQPDLVDGVKKGRLLNRSQAFFSPQHESNPKPGTYYPRHLGFLGGSAPGIPGMRPLETALAFSAEDTLETTGDPAEAVIYEATPTPTISFRASQEPTMADETTLTQEQLDERARRLSEQETAFAARQRAARTAGNATLVDGLIAGARLLPKDRDKALFVFNALDDKDDEDKALEFDAGENRKLSPAAALADLLGSGAKLVPVDEGRRSPSGEFQADDVDKVKGDPSKIAAAARKLMAEDKNLTFEAAVEQVTGQEE